MRREPDQFTIDVPIDQPCASYSVSELAILTEANRGTIPEAVESLSELDAVETKQDVPMNSHYVFLVRSRPQ